jgi:transcriptional repressor NrdR
MKDFISENERISVKINEKQLQIEKDVLFDKEKKARYTESRFLYQGGSSMKCPFCSSENTRVIDSRPADDNNSIRRRRLCDDCGKRFTTYERVETIPLIVIKKDENREQYDRLKLQGGILRACHKRPVSVAQIDQLVDKVEAEIFNKEEREILSSRIGEIVMNHLQELDPVAYVRFASVYREFKDVNTFMDELKKMLDQES